MVLAQEIGGDRGRRVVGRLRKGGGRDEAGYERSRLLAVGPLLQQQHGISSLQSLGPAPRPATTYLS